MKTLLVLAILTLTLPSAYAGRRPLGSSCGLVDYSGDDLIQDVEGSFQSLSSKRLKLSTLQKQQVIVAAKALSVQEEQTSEIENTAQALEILNDMTSDGAFIGKITIKGKAYDQVMTYPGDNPVGVIFKEGTVHIVAYINDSDVDCAVRK